MLAGARTVDLAEEREHGLQVVVVEEPHVRPLVVLLKRHCVTMLSEIKIHRAQSFQGSACARIPRLLVSESPRANRRSCWRRQGTRPSSTSPAARPPRGPCSPARRERIGRRDAWRGLAGAVVVVDDAEQHERMHHHRGLAGDNLALAHLRGSRAPRRAAADRCANLLCTFAAHSLISHASKRNCLTQDTRPAEADATLEEPRVEHQGDGHGDDQQRAPHADGARPPPPLVPHVVATPLAAVWRRCNDVIARVTSTQRTAGRQVDEGVQTCVGWQVLVHLKYLHRRRRKHLRATP